MDNGDDDNKASSFPHEALFMSLSYLPVQELLAMSQTCSSMRDTIKNDDVLPWMNVVVERPLSWRLNDESLIRIASMAKGKLQSLSLFHCINITDHAILCVVEANPLVEKLLVPGCTGLSPEGIIRAVKSLLSKKGHTLTKLHINGVHNIQKHHLQTLNSYLQLNNTWPQNSHHQVIDLEICPRCDEPRLVFSCPRQSCQMTKPREQCRGCSNCIPRCKDCSVCVDAFDEIEEALCDDVLCSDCWLRLPKCIFCNKPYCKQHGNEKIPRDSFSSSGLSGFVCDVCCAKFVDSASQWLKI